MEPWISERYHPGILSEARSRFGIEAGNIRELPSFENYIFAFERGDGEYILRIGHNGRRCADLVRGEVDWINYLSDGGVPVARAVTSLGGSLVEPIPDGHGDHFLAAAFLRAHGKHADWERSLEFYRAYGRMLGRMHALTRHYQPSRPAWRRPEWDSPLMQAVVWKLPEEEAGVVERYRELLAHLKTLPRTSEVYGLVHQDAHTGNFLLDEHGRLMLFDFDDCGYNWYAYDIAIALFYMVNEAPEGLPFAADFMPGFLQGYREEYQIDEDMLRQVPHFLKQREIELYGVIYDAFGPNPVEDEWCLKYMHTRRERIESALPFIPDDILLPALGLLSS